MENTSLEIVKVSCHSGHTYAERPESFTWEEIVHIVQTVEKEWIEPGEKHFKVRTDDNKLFELCYYVEADQWTLRDLA